MSRFVMAHFESRQHADWTSTPNCYKPSLIYQTRAPFVLKVLIFEALHEVTKAVRIQCERTDLGSGSCKEHKLVRIIIVIFSLGMRSVNCGPEI
jgi:hypothetical protein